MFKFKGISSNDMQVVVEEEEEFIARAAHKYEQIDIDGRDGAEFNELGYSVVERPICVQCLNIDKIDEILAWLDGEGEFEYKGRKTIARFYSELDPKRSSCIRIIDATFIRDPFWYTANEEYILVKDDKSVKISGENIHIEDSSNARCDIEICGNHEQDVRSGKNKLLNDTASITKNGVTFTKNDDGSVIANGTATDGINYYLSEILTTIEAGTYKLSDGINGASSTTYFTFVDLKNEDGSVYDEGNLSTAGVSSREYTDSKLIKGRIVVRKGVTLSNVVFKPQLELVKNVNDTATDYEQYGASPSIDYPSEIKAVGSNVNLLDESKASVKTVNGMTFSYSKSEGLILNGTTTALTNFWLLNLEKSLEPGNYTLSSNIDLENKGVYVLKAGNSNLIQSRLKEAVTFETSKVTVTELLIQINANVTFNKQSLKIKLEKGTKATPYSSYGCGSAKVDIVNKNVLNPQIDERLDDIKVINQDDMIVINGNNAHGHQVFFKNKVKYKPNTNYKVTITKVSGSCTEFSPGKKWAMLFYASSKTTNIQILPSSTTIKFSFVSPNGKFTPYFWFGFDSSSVVGTNGVFNNYTLKIQIEEKNFSDYVPHQEQSYLVDVQQPMLKGDYLDLENEKEHHGWRKIIFDGTENWLMNYGTGMFYVLNLFRVKDINSRLGISNYLKYNNVNSGIYNTLKDGEFAIQYTQENYTRLFMKNLNITTVADWKTWLKSKYDCGNPVEVYYQLATPIDLEFTEAQKAISKQIKEAHTYKNITNISAESAEVNPILNVEYLEDTNEKIINRGNLISRPILKLEKTRYNDVDLTINDIRFKYHFKNDKYVEIDCEQKLVKCDGIDRNRQIEIGYEFPKLKLKENDIIMHLGDCKIKVLRKDRWL